MGTLDASSSSSSSSSQPPFLASLLPSFFQCPCSPFPLSTLGVGRDLVGLGLGTVQNLFYNRVEEERERERERERRGEFQLVHLEPSFLSFLSQSAFGSSREKEEKKRERERERERERRKAEKEESEAALAQHAIRITKYCFSPLEDFLCPVLSTPGREGKTLSPVQPSPTRRSRQPTCYGFFKRGWPASFTKVRSEDPSETRFKEPTQPNLCKGHVN